MIDAILVLNGGSSSLKFAVFEGRDQLPLLLRGNVSSLGHQPRLRVEAAAGRSRIDRSLGEAPIDMDKALAAVSCVLAENDLLRRIDRVGHRIVHGGRDFTEATLLDERTLKALRLLEPERRVCRGHGKPSLLDVVMVERVVEMVEGWKLRATSRS